MTERTLPVIEANGLLFMADPHFAATPPGQRLEGYTGQILDKVAAGLAHCRAETLVPVILGDLFHWPRENPNSLLVALIELFRPCAGSLRPWVLVGNHDKYQARYTPDVSLAVLEAAGVVTVVSECGPQFRLRAPGGRALVGGSPDFTPIPDAFSGEPGETVIWITHHNIGFPDYQDKPIRIRPIPGVDWVLNGHIHRPQPQQLAGTTRWVNAGGLTRMQFTHGNRERQPAALIWTPACQARGELERLPLRFLPFETVFPDQELPPEPDQAAPESAFVTGLERLAWRRTREGLGLRQFLEQNLARDTPEDRLLWELYEEVVNGKTARQ